MTFLGLPLFRRMWLSLESIQTPFQKGDGKVTRLCLYKDNYDVEGNPYLPSLSIKRMIYANYQHEWSILNHKYRDMVHELVTYLERRYSMHVLR